MKKIENCKFSESASVANLLYCAVKLKMSSNIHNSITNIELICWEV